jgi:hypothetical protein
MWECFNKGALPYGNLNQFETGVQVCYQGLRLMPPSEKDWPSCGNLMMRCFQEPDKRPEFLKIHDEIEYLRPIYEAMI